MDLSPHVLGGFEFNFSTLPAQVVNGVLNGAIYALIALGYTMVYGVLRLINFAHGEVYMLGAYTALFVSWGLGFTEGVRRESSPVNLLLMLLASMVVCMCVGVIIERSAYRPMRNQPRIASLITAIGVSMLLQYGGALFLPNNPPPTISEQVNPYRGVVSVQLRAPKETVQAAYKAAADEFAAADKRFQDQLQHEKSEFDLSPQGQQVRDAKFRAQANFRLAEKKVTDASVSLRMTYGQLTMLAVSLVLMAVLWFLVMRTSVGRSMRAVSHDFDTAALMGVNVNRIVTITFMIGSGLAGAGAMMTATFLSTSISPFYGLLPGVKAFVAAVLGGIGNIPGAVLGGLLMGVAETLVVWMGKSEYRDAVAFIVLILVLLVRPGGLLGSAKVEKV